jgi:hypothetical protein
MAQLAVTWHGHWPLGYGYEELLYIQRTNCSTDPSSKYSRLSTHFPRNLSTGLKWCNTLLPLDQGQHSFTQCTHNGRLPLSDGINGKGGRISTRLMGGSHISARLIKGLHISARLIEVIAVVLYHFTYH